MLWERQRINSLLPGQKRGRQIVAQVTHANIRDSSGNPMISFHRLTRFMHKTLSSRWVNTPLEHTHTNAHSLYLSLELLFMDARRLEYFISSRREPKEAGAKKIKYEIRPAFFILKKERLLSMKTYISKESRTHFEFFFLCHRERVEVNDELSENFHFNSLPAATLCI